MELEKTRDLDALLLFFLQWGQPDESRTVKMRFRKIPAGTRAPGKTSDGEAPMRFLIA